MTPALWLFLYVSIVLVLGAIAIGWTDGVWRRHQDEREARQERALRAGREWMLRNAPPLDWQAAEKPRHRTFKHRNLRVALQARSRMEMGAR